MRQIFVLLCRRSRTALYNPVFVFLLLYVRLLKTKVYYPGGGAKLLFSLLLEIRPSNINLKYFMLIKEIQKNIFCQGRPRGEGNLFIFILRDRTFKLKNQYFHINESSSKKRRKTIARRRGSV